MAILDTTLRPTGRYSLRQSARGASDETRSFDGRTLSALLRCGADVALARATQLGDGRIALRVDAADPDAAVERLRFVLGLDDDHEGFLELAAADDLLRDCITGREGLRPLRTATVAHALLRALAGQLITAREARSIERRAIRAACTPYAGMHAPPTAADLDRLPRGLLESFGLAPRRADALVRTLRTIDLERLHAVTTAAAVARLQHEPMLGPWSAGVIAIEGLGRYEHGIAGDLSLMRLCTALLGRPAELADTETLLARYGAWAGLASIHLCAHPLAHERGPGATRRTVQIAEELNRIDAVRARRAEVLARLAAG